MLHIPNLITLINVLAGCCAAIALWQGYGYWTVGFLAIAGAADFADGLAARILGISSPIGKELDSLADMLSFGFIPGLIAYTLLQEATGTVSAPISWYAVPGFAITLFAALRLAKFNLDDRQTKDFIGLPTPSCTLFFAGLLLINLEDSFGLKDVILQPVLLYILVAVFSLLMVSELPMFGFKFNSSSWKGNEIRYIFMGVGILLLLLLKEAAFSAIILLYLLIAISQLFLQRSKS
jgi:CDP-diacylglycerol--serine O-phosphatidyltransferase